MAGIQNIINLLGLSSYISITNLIEEFDNERLITSVRCVKILRVGGLVNSASAIESEMV